MVSASQLYDYVQCPHKVFLDAYGDVTEKDATSPFVELLWVQGLVHEAKIAEQLPVTANLSKVAVAERERETQAAMRRKEHLIYGGLIRAADAIGEPDLLELNTDGYVPGDIKSGSGMEGDDTSGKLKKHYAFQLAHYVSILEQLGAAGSGRTPYVIDRDSKRVPYPLMSAQGTRNQQTWWDGYQHALGEIRSLLDRSLVSSPALGGGTCKLCHWHSHCTDAAVSAGDLTLIAELGRSKRDAMSAVIPTIHAFADCDPEAYVQKKKTIFSGVGPETLRKLHERARLLADPHGKPYLTAPVALPINEKEVYFDIEADPMHGIVYLHGFVERGFARPETARASQFFAETVNLTQEETAFGQAWAHLVARIQDSTIYYYSKYERTEYKKLAEKYPSVCSVDDVEALFAMPAMIDLYFDVVKKFTEWPLYDQSIKTVAQYLGFKWRDVDPSGAASIEWYNRWLESHDPEIKRRILEYNEDDCLATGVVVDQIRRLPVKA